MLPVSISMGCFVFRCGGSTAQVYQSCCNMLTRLMRLPQLPYICKWIMEPLPAVYMSVHGMLCKQGAYPECFRVRQDNMKPLFKKPWIRPKIRENPPKSTYSSTSSRHWNDHPGSVSKSLLGGGFKYFLFSPLPEKMIQFDQYFSNGLVQPPTRLHPSKLDPRLVSFFLKPNASGLGSFIQRFAWRCSRATGKVVR